MAEEIIYVWLDGSWCDAEDVLEYIEIHGDNYSIVVKSSEYAQMLIRDSL